MEFKDYFSKQASSYAAFRPKSPKGLFEYLLTLVRERNVAWDVGTGNGQAALELAPYFNRVIATDASAEQIRHAIPHPKVIYRVAMAEQSGIDEKVDLITVAQAFHWFDFEKFFEEVRRVAATEAVIGIFTYDLAFIEPKIDELVRDYSEKEIGRFWPSERRWVDEHYQTIPFPFREITAPEFRMVEDRNFEQWAGYLFSWSATQRAIKELGPKVFENFLVKLEKLWGAKKEIKRVTWPMHLRVGHV